MVDLGTLGGPTSAAYGINAAGAVVGRADVAPNRSHAFLWTPEAGMRDLGTLGGLNSSATSISDTGVVVGSTELPDGHRHAFVLSPPREMDSLGGLGGPHSDAYAVNEAGCVVGESGISAPRPWVTHPFCWTPDHGMQDLGWLGGHSRPSLELDSAQVFNPAYAAWLDEQKESGAALAVNAHGQVVGWSGHPAEPGQPCWHAFLWTRGAMLDLGTLGGLTSDALGINSAGHLGQVVGTSDVGSAGGDQGWGLPGWNTVADPSQDAKHAFLWTDGLMIDLNQLIEPDGSWVLAAARAIDDAGRIVGYGMVNSCRRAFLLTPVPASPGQGAGDTAPPPIAVAREQPGSPAGDQALAQLAALGVTNLTERAHRGELPRCYGRDAEVDQVFGHLLEGRSVLLLGASGVGKSAVLYEAIRRMVDGTAPEPLRNKRVVQVSTSRLEAGSLNAGGWAQTLSEMVDAIKRAQDVYLYFDDIWNLPDAGRYSGARTSFASHLRPHLAAREIVLLGESTADNYRRAGTAGRDIVRGYSLADDESLMSHFGMVTLQEPEPAVTREVLSWVAMEREIERRVHIDSAAIDRCINLTRRFLPSEAFPGKAVRLLDSTARTHQSAPRSEDSGADAPTVITSEMVMHGFGQMTGLPERVFSDAIPLSSDEIRAFFADRVIGQEDAVASVVDVVSLVKAELTDPERPLGVLLFVGPTGSGKTFLAQTLAEFLFGSAEKLVRFDMSEYESWDRAGDLSRRVVERLEKERFSVVLFDEVEKAHPLVFDLFLQLFDEGRLTDPEGRRADLRNSIIIMTSNLGSAEARRGGLGFVEEGGRARWEYQRAVEEFFRPELVNRFDNIVVFHPLSIADMRRIARRELGKALLRQGVQRRNILLDFDEGVLDVLLSTGFNERFGARPLQRAIKDYVLVPLAKQIARQPDSTDQLLELRAVGEQVEMRRIALTPTGSQVETATVETEDPGATTDPQRQESPSRRHLEDEVDQLCARIAAQRASDRFRAVEERASVLLLETAHPTFWDDQNQAREMLSRLYDLERIIDRWASLRDRAEAVREGLARLPAASDALATKRIATAKEAILHEVALGEIELLANDPEDLVSHAVMIGVSPVAGPSIPEPSDWPRVLHEMYRAWAEARGYEAETVNDDGSVELLLLVHGPGVAAMLEGEAGIHKRQLPRRSEPRRAAGTEAQLARVEITLIPNRALNPQEMGAIHLAYLEAVPPEKGKNAPRRRVEAHHAPSGTRVRLLGQDPGQFAAAFLRARVDAATDQEADTIVRLYNFAGTQYVRDPRTGQRSARARDVLRGDLDPFLLAYLEHANR